MSVMLSLALLPASAVAPPGGAVAGFPPALPRRAVE